jgi:hypothetical protein
MWVRTRVNDKGGRDVKAQYVGWRFRVEAALAVLSGVLAAATLVWSDWLEIVFGVDPDHHSGSLEWMIVAIAATVSVGLVALARRDWRRAAPSPA